jgi:predicted XRE-type DNA-binding protein
MKMTKSSGNVFADLGLPEPEERLLKAQLASQIARTITTRNLTQSAAAAIMGIDQPKVSHLLHGRLAGFSVDRLLTWLTELGQAWTSSSARRRGAAPAAYACVWRRLAESPSALESARRWFGRAYYDRQLMGRRG